MSEEAFVPKEGFSYDKAEKAGRSTRFKSYVTNLGIVRGTLDDGGSTTFVSGAKPTSGTAVSLGGFEQTVPKDDFGLSPLQRYTHTPEHLGALTARPNRALGTWVDADQKGDPQVFLDVSRVFKDTPRSNRLARISTVGSNQMGSFNLGTFTTEYNPLHPEVLSRVGGDVKLDEGESERYMTSEKPIGTEVVFGETTTPQKISRGRGRKRTTVQPGQGTFIFTGSDQMAPPPNTQKK
jgi:hypothetical protein